MRALVACLGGALLGACAPTSASPPEPDREAAWALSERMQEFRHQLIEHTEAFIAAPDDPMAGGYWNQSVSMVGREDLLYQNTEDGNQTAYPACADARPDPLPELLEAAADTSIVIINEYHARPNGRLFILDLAESLKEMGYETYAAEAFSDGVRDEPDVPPTADDGYFVGEPVFGRLLSSVRGMGYHLVAYEQRYDQMAPEDAPPDTQIDRREAAQAQNLMDAVFVERPSAKVLIHVGHSHVAERPLPYVEKQSGPDKDGMHWMASRLKAATGVDPVTISVTECIAEGDAPVLASAGKRRDGKLRPVYTDYVVGLPRITLTDGRPDYRRRMGDIETTVPEALRPAGKPVLVEARRPGEGDEVTPSDRLYLRPREVLPLMLPAGETFEIRGYDGDGLVAGPVIVMAGAS